jgi:hypothetical protein
LITLFTEAILKKVPQERLSLQEICNSDWLKGVPFPVTPGASESCSLSPTFHTPISKTPENHSENVPRKTDSPETVLVSEGNKASLQCESDMTVKPNSMDNQSSVEGPLAVQTDLMSRQQQCYSGSEKKENEIVATEMLARKKLLDFGITSAMLEEHSSRGARSAIIGTYRIVIHRIQRRGHVDVDSASVDDVDGLPSAVPSRSASTNHFFLPSFGRRSKSAAVKSKGHKPDKTNRSRTCILL